MHESQQNCNRLDPLRRMYLAGSCKLLEVVDVVVIVNVKYIALAASMALKFIIGERSIRVHSFLAVKDRQTCRSEVAKSRLLEQSEERSRDSGAPKRGDSLHKVNG